MFLVKCKRLAKREGVLRVRGEERGRACSDDKLADHVIALMFRHILDEQVWKLERPMAMPHEFQGNPREVVYITRRGDRYLAVTYQLGHPVGKSIVRIIRRMLET